MAQGKSNKNRRREVRKSIPREKPTWRELSASRRLRWGVFYAVVFVVAAGSLVLKAKFEHPYQLGQLIDHTIVSRVDFESTDEKQTESEREAARDNEPSIYVQNNNFFEVARTRILALPTIAANPESVDEIAETIRSEFPFTEEVLSELKGFYEEGQPTVGWTGLVDKLLSNLAWVPIVSQKTFQEEMGRRAPEIMVMVGANNPALMTKRLLLVNSSDSAQVLQAIEDDVTGFPPATAKCLIGFFQNTGEPSYRLDSDMTAKARELAAQNVEDVKHRYLANKSVLVPAGKRIDGHDLELLGKEQARYISGLGWTYATIDGAGGGDVESSEDIGLFMERLQWTKRLLLELGPLLLVIAITIGMCVTVMLHHRRIADNPMRGLAMLCLLLGMLLLSWMWREMGPSAVIAAGIGPTMLACVVLSISYSRRLAVTMGVLQAMLVSLALNLSIGAFMAILAACVLSVVQLKGLRQRGELIRMGFFTGLAVAVCVMAAGLSEHRLVPGMLLEIIWSAAWSFSAALAVGFIVLGLLTYIEKAFKVTTGMTLLELGDMNQPLLKRLAQVAPSTFNHSLQVAVLAEAGAEAIGADALLCRVGAYYHDIGKMNKPQYFIENQIVGASRHEKLSPAMSLLIIVGHVKDGVEMSREYGLPPVVRHLIESHHGTTLVEYFFHEAKKQGDDDPDATAPKEIEYQYSGPKPRTREAAILLLCDSVEAAARSLPEPSVMRIEQLVHGLMNKRLMDGQFDNCNLTLNELRLISDAVTKALAGIYHSRIAYPKVGEGEGKNGSGNGSSNGNGRAAENRSAEDRAAV